jgi:uncharacterized Zn-binding protein involved in type VI secretion
VGEPAAVQGDKITGQCGLHQVPNPSSGAPQPSPGPLPFSAPLLQGLASTVFVSGKPAAVEESSGLNTPSHIGLHASDPFFAPNTQKGSVFRGSSTVLIEGKGAAKTGSQTMICGGLPGQLVGSASTVLIGG